ncbi:S-layer homology domain-containing protein [Cohnella sp. AR92]|uniref:S-layer homology domain-containing protein n=1 Tax=Cohnella sp. AR92 TaxID=648716 RepID=UPI000F8D4EC5|nr:S-layer homology domain-containing protein [Cohnella sp. AR92]RUS46292.1 S-layer homology domain-containing protein [Cohnella sp. AR92]
MAIALRGKSWISLVIILALVWTGLAFHAPRASAAASTPFSDVPAGHWAEKHIAKLALQGLVKGNNGLYSPNSSLTRQEAVLIALRFMGLEDKVNTSDVVAFPDTFSVDNYFKPYVNYAFKQNLISMSEEFEIANKESAKKWGSTPASREWIARLLVRAIGKNADAADQAGKATSFADNASIGSEYLGFINVAVSNGLVNGIDGNKFDPKGNVTRATAATLFSRAEAKAATSFPGQATGILLQVSPTQLKLLQSNGTITNYAVTDGTLFSRSDTEKLGTVAGLKAYGEALVIGSGDGTAAYAEQLSDTARVKTAEGELVVVSASKSQVTVLNGDDVATYPYDSANLPAVTDSEGNAISLSDIPAGAKLKLVVDNYSSAGKLLAVSVTTSTVNKSGSGTIVSFDSATGALTVKDSATAVSETRSVASTATIQKDGEYVKKTELKAGASITYKISNGEYTDIVITKSSGQTVSGYFFKADTTEKTIQYTSSLNSSDIKAKFYDKNVTVAITGVTNTGLNDLFKGDSIELTVNDSGTVIGIAVKDRSIKTLSGGTISSYVADDNIVLIKDSSGKSSAYEINANTRYDYNGTTITKATAQNYFIKGRKVDIGYSEGVLYYISFVSRYSGTVITNDTSTHSLTLKLADGTNQSLYYGSPTVELFGKSSATYANVAKGDVVTAYLSSDQTSIVSIKVLKTAQLEVVSVDANTNKLTVQNASTGVTTSWTIDSSVKFTNVNGSASTLSALTAGDTINATLLGNTLQSVQSIKITLGILESVGSSSLTVNTYDGDSEVINAASTVIVTKGGATYSTLSSLKTDDRVEVRVNENGQTIVNVLSPITKTVWYLNGDTVYFKKSSTTVETEYVAVRTGAYIHSGDATIALSSLANGVSVTYYVYRNQAIEIVK